MQNGYGIKMQSKMVEEQGQRLSWCTSLDPKSASTVLTKDSITIVTGGLVTAEALTTETDRSSFISTLTTAAMVDKACFLKGLSPVLTKCERGPALVDGAIDLDPVSLANGFVNTEPPSEPHIPFHQAPFGCAFTIATAGTGERPTHSTGPTQHPPGTQRRSPVTPAKASAPDGRNETEEDPAKSQSQVESSIVTVDPVEPTASIPTEGMATLV
ncbi:hypothetical protein BU23DRAFT_626304 [Bimuria novae-zelandiae CBS 107.79]|uniref:Uncharacterized protein n=1 Tax=Bimuria novae-zelandiae CBS 107.79 TaxID=1447943 RepID=A0A6A5VJF6_9PLEO|nr:hypothetical protein BU23DRAFT_626304 [Bimuria novae-zelandiae CBS 107.79]